MDASGINVGLKWMVAGLAYLVFRDIVRLETIEKKVDELCREAKIEPLKPRK